MNKTQITSQQRVEGLSSIDYASKLENVVWITEKPWQLRNHVLVPLSMPHLPIQVDREELRNAMKANSALAAFWTSNWDGYSTSEWWWTCCDQFITSIEDIPSARSRRSVRKGLRSCKVLKISTKDFPMMAYPIYKKALERYGNNIPTYMDYEKDVLDLGLYSGTEFWGAFVNDTMASYVICFIIDGAVSFGSSKSDRLLDRNNPNAALFYTVSQHYMYQGFTFTTNGWRTLWHPTAINDYLERMGFRRVYCRLNLELSGIAKIIDWSKPLCWGKWIGLNHLFSKRWDLLNGFDKLTKIAKTFEVNQSNLV